MNKEELEQLNQLLIKASELLTVDDVPPDYITVSDEGVIGIRVLYGHVETVSLNQYDEVITESEYKLAEDG